MAGLAGILSLKGALDAAEASAMVERMGRRQAHRAPDGWRVLAHRGLVYVHDDDGSLEEGVGGRTLAFDGVITNGRELREDLRHAGADLRSKSDRELVLRAWEHWGEASLGRLSGRFAFVLHDPARATSTLVRDRFGHKPFHYAIADGRLYFASEIKTLLTVVPAALNERALIEWSMYGDVLPPRTLFAGIRALAPGSLLEIGREGPAPTARPYYDPTTMIDPALYAQYATRPIPDLLDELESAVESAVVSHIGEQSRVGVMLSGGVDSTVIAALAARHANLPAYHFFVSGDPATDERSVAEEVARKLDIPLHTIRVDPDTYRRELARTTLINEMPSWHVQCVPIGLLARRAGEDDLRLLLSGVSVGPFLGAAGDRYRWILPHPLMSRVPGGLFRIARKSVYSAAGLSVANPFFAQNLGVGLKMVDGGARSRVVARSNEAYGFVEDPRARRIPVMRMADDTLFLRRFYHQGDRLCMAESIEYCDASMEPEFVTLALNLPAELLIHDKKPKWTLKELATRYVPQEIAFQKKASLDVPVDQYFAPLFKPSLFRGGFLESVLEMDWALANELLRAERERAHLLFQLVHIEVWGRLFFLQQTSEEVTALLSG